MTDKDKGDNVVDFGTWKPRVPDAVWTCPCESQLFYITEWGVRCFGCGRNTIAEEDGTVRI